MISPKLSICIATYNRGSFIGETLNSILCQLVQGVELIVVDGASSDNTFEIMTQYLLKYPEIQYFRLQENSGFDCDYDKAVSYARGEYCWLMSDDDLLRSDAIATVLSALESDNDLFIVNSEVKNADLSTVLNDRLVKIHVDREYSKSDGEDFFVEVAKYISFVGCVVIRRVCWMSRDRSSYYGTWFVHVGVIFQTPSIVNVRLISEPLITIRYGNSNWTSLRFMIWMFKWPNLVWSFSDFSDAAKHKVCRRKPWQRSEVLLKHRALGSYTATEYDKLTLSDIGKGMRIKAYILSILPASLANFMMVFYLLLFGKNKELVLYDLLHSRHAGASSHFLARVLHRKLLD